MPGTPVLAGQHSFYAITQLFLFREGRRSNEAMTAVAKTMNDADLRGFSDFIGTLPPVPAPAPATPPDAARMKQGRRRSRSSTSACSAMAPTCAGGQQVPRIAGQREDYLQMSLHGFKSGTAARLHDGDERGGEPGHPGGAGHAGVLRGAFPRRGARARQVTCEPGASIPEPYQRPNVLTRPSHKAPSSAPIGWSPIEAVLATAV